MKSFIASSRQSVWPTVTTSPTSTNGGRSGRRRAVEDADHRRLDAGRRPAGPLAELHLGALGQRGERRGDHAHLVGAPHGHAHAVVLDLDLAHAGLLHDLDELADPLGPGRVDVAEEERRLARVALADRLQQRLGLVAEHREQDEVLLARGEPLGGLAHVLGARRILVEAAAAARDERDGTGDRLLDRRRRDAVGALDEHPELVEHGAVAAGREDVEQRLGREDLADRRRERRPAGLGPDPHDLRQRVEQAVARGVRAEMDVERGDEAGRKVVLGRAHGDPRRDGRDGLVADVLVDEIRRLPERRGVDARLAAEPVERVDERLARDAVQRQRERVDGGGDQIGADARRDDGVEEPRAGRALDEQPDGEARRLPDALDELLGEVRQQRVGRVVDDHAGRAERGNLLRPLDERVDLAGAAGAVDEADVELLARRDDRLAGLDQVRDVVERVVEPEDVDPVVGRAGDEPAHDVGGDRARADEEATAQGEAERCRRARVDRADPLPGALDGAAHGRVEDAAARDLEVREAGPVEDLGDPQHLAGGQLAGERILREQADGGVDDLGHVEVDLIVAFGATRPHAG